MQRFSLSSAFVTADGFEIGDKTSLILSNSLGQFCLSGEELLQNNIFFVSL